MENNKQFSQSRMHQGGSTKANFNFLNRPASYYNPIPRGSDLADKTGSLYTKPLNVGRVGVPASKVPIDLLVARALDDLSDQLILLAYEPDQDEIVSDSIEELLAKGLLMANAPENEKNKLENKLKADGLTGELIQASSQLIRSLSNEDQHFLSRKGVFFYVAYRVIVGLGVDDVDGIVSNILVSLDKVRSHINRLLVDKVIETANLVRDEDVVSKLKDILGLRAISYEVGRVLTQITEEYEKLTKEGFLQIREIVLEFLQSGEVELPYGTDVEQVADEMISYLFDIGYKLDEVNLEEQINELRTDITTVNVVLGEKADISELQALSTRVDGVSANLSGKADKSELANVNDELANINNTLQDKADKSDLTEINGQFDTLNAALQDKADKSDLTEINGQLDTLNAALQDKADKSDLTEINGQLDTLNAALQDKADKTDLSSINAEIEGINTAMKTKIEKSVFDTKVKSLTSSIGKKADKDLADKNSKRIEQLERLVRDLMDGTGGGGDIVG